MDERLSRLESQLDHIAEQNDEMIRIMERNTTSLEYHIKRTNQLEVEVRAIKSHVDGVTLIGGMLLKTLTAVSIIAGIATALSKYLGN